MDKAALQLNICEIEILIYALERREGLGPHADSARRKLQTARREILTEAEKQTPLFAEEAMKWKQ